MNFIDANNIELIYEDFSDPIIFNKLDIIMMIFTC